MRASSATIGALSVNGDNSSCTSGTSTTHRVRAVRTKFYFDGGDLLADNSTVFVSPAVLQANLQRTVESEQQLISELSNLLARPIVLLRQAPPHHIGMYMMVVADRTMIVGSPALARQLLERTPLSSDLLEKLPGGPDFTPSTQQLFDAVADQVSSAGYRVVRIPVVPACDGKTYLTYVNALTQSADSDRVVHLPQYRDADVLNQSACEIWSQLGYRICPIDCTDIFPAFGTIHCLVNVLDRS